MRVQGPGEHCYFSTWSSSPTSPINPYLCLYLWCKLCFWARPTPHQQYLTTLHLTKSKIKTFSDAKKSNVTSHTSFKRYVKVLSIKNKKNVVFQEIGYLTSQEEVKRIPRVWRRRLPGYLLCSRVRGQQALIKQGKRTQERFPQGDEIKKLSDTSEHTEKRLQL